MGKVRNILFIMADQLRWDYLSCYGHPHLKTIYENRVQKKDNTKHATDVGLYTKSYGGQIHKYKS